MFTKYGYEQLGIAVLVAFALIAAGIFSSNSFIKVSFFIIAGFILITALQFFRDPDRKIPDEENIVVSPADGKVIVIKDVYDETFINGKAKQISIFMSPVNVHVNRIPLSGTVKYLKYHKGLYLAAYHEKASEKNERMEIGIESEKGRVLFTQIAGVLARRIVCDLKDEEQVEIGKRFGMIKFGSRVDVIVPESWEAAVEMDTHVKAGETILFRIPG